MDALRKAFRRALRLRWARNCLCKFEQSSAADHCRRIPFSLRLLKHEVRSAALQGDDLITYCRLNKCADAVEPKADEAGSKHLSAWVEKQLSNEVSALVVNRLKRAKQKALIHSTREQNAKTLQISNEVNNSFLCFHVRFDVALGGGERSVSSQHLNVPERPSNS